LREKGNIFFTQNNRCWQAKVTSCSSMRPTTGA
jgi:hypothetical protein